MSAGTSSVVLFDGVCGLCTRSVRFILRRDSSRRLQFASLQSAVGRQLAAEAGVEGKVLETLILIEDGRAFVRSDAVLRIAGALGAPWSLVAPLLLVPRFIREPLYRIVARHRYRFFGRLDREWAPASAYEERFLDSVSGDGTADSG
jgi:predicted DCC family thiol-disulfide oxidoreductase YuxK